MGSEYIWQAFGLPKPEIEFRISKERRYKWDYAWPQFKIALEQNGGIWMRGITGRGGAHSLPSNIIRDMEKMNFAQKLGWRVFQFQPKDIRNGTAANFLRSVMEAK